MQRPPMPGCMRRGFAFALVAAVACLAAPTVSAANTFSNADGITINDGLCHPASAATPYPSRITVSRLEGTITDVDVTLSGLAHTWPDDVAVLLVGPSGETTVLMQDNGGGDDLASANLTFDDAAAGPLPPDSQIVGGTYLPTVGDEFGIVCSNAFPSPAPAGPYGSELSVFNGTDPNGAWSLYVVDDSRGDTGSISSWSLDITVAPPDAAGQLEAVATDLQAIVDAETGSSLADKAEDALAKVRSALAKLGQTPPDGQGAVGEIEGAVGDLEAAVKDGGFAEGTDLMDRLAGAARLLAEEAIAEAKARGGAPDKIAEAEHALAKGDAKRASARFKDAVAEYKDAASKAEGAAPSRVAGHLYWTNFRDDNRTAAIGRANLDGSGVDQSFIALAGQPKAVAVDTGHIYWGSEVAGWGAIARANLDGTGVNESFIADGASAIAVDAGHVYWVNHYWDTIGRANLDGTGGNGSFIAATGAFSDHERFTVAVDAGHVYWTHHGHTGTIGRANLDGTGVNESFITGASNPIGVAVDAAHVYWTNNYTGTIGRAKLDGTGVNHSFITGASGPFGIAVDAGHVYWANSNAGTIGRAKLDGTGVNQSFITGASFPAGVAVGSR